MRFAECFSGAGGGILAHHVLLGHTPIMACDWAAYPRQVLAHRQDDGLLPYFDILGDIRHVRGTPYRARLKTGMLAGGFPCKGLSPAGPKTWLNHPESRLVYEMIRIVAEAQPKYVFAENSFYLRKRGLDLITHEMQKLGYGTSAWCILSAGDLGAFHERKRMWVLFKRSPVTHPIGKDFFSRKTHRGVKGMYKNGVLVGDRYLPLELEDLGIETMRREDLLPTMLTSDAKAAGNRPGPGAWSLCDRSGITGKCRRLGMLPTLAATDWKSPYSTAGLEKQLQKRAKPLRDMLPYIVGTGKAINPYWAEWFMGWPLGWTDVLNEPTRKGLQAWKRASVAGRWWSPTWEKQVLPPTLQSTRDVPKQKQRITALGNGQVPLVAATAEAALMSIVEGV